MSTPKWPDKDPDEVLDYDIDWSARLLTDTIATSEWIMAAGNLVKDSDTFSTSATKIWLSAGDLNITYQLTNRITTAGARTMDQTVRLSIKAK